MKWTHRETMSQGLDGVQVPDLRPPAQLHSSGSQPDVSSISCHLQPRVLTNRERKTLTKLHSGTKQLIKFSLTIHPPEKLVGGARGTMSQVVKTKKVDLSHFESLLCNQHREKC